MDLFGYKALKTRLDEVAVQNNMLFILIERLAKEAGYQVIVHDAGNKTYVAFYDQKKPSTVEMNPLDNVLNQSKGGKS